jgi:hypothetical protein
MNEHVPLQPVPRTSAAPQTSGMAITSLVLGITSFFCWIFTGLPAVILGIVALRKINRSQGQLRGDGLAIAGIVTGAISSFVILPVMVALMLPAVQAAREAARRNVSLNNLKQISLALQMHADTHNGVFPAAKGEAGSQLSWRVHILPFIEEQALYEQFHLDEPWDSEHNRALIARMPAIFKDPADRLPPGETSYLAVTGPGTAFGDGTTGPALRDFSDGLSSTIMLVEADSDQSVAWTKPDDWQFDPNNPRRGLGSSRPGGFLAILADSSSRFIHNDTDPESVKAMMTRDGGEPVEFR